MLSTSPKHEKVYGTGFRFPGQFFSAPSEGFAGDQFKLLRNCFGFEAKSKAYALVFACFIRPVASKFVP